MLPILNALTNALQADDRLVIDGKLAKNKIVELALNLDPALLKLLLADEQLKKHFFQDVDGMLIFDKVAFQRFVNNKSFLPDSYTQFKNKIGLASDTHYLSESNDIVLAWPYKDCVLEGGQTKEDQKRNEIFWNETLAPEQVDTLLAPKAFVNFKKFDKQGEHTDFEMSGEDNLVIKGNNLLALHSLERNFNQKIKLIYIDPPFNTGSDGFNYNDRFNHSTWLTFMMNRLKISKNLLSNDGVIALHIGNEEASYAQVLLDEIYGRENYLNHITMTTNAPSGFKATSSKIFSTANHIFLYAKNRDYTNLNKLYVRKEYDSAYKYYLKNPLDNYKNWEFCLIIDAIAEQEGFADAKTLKKSLSKVQLEDKISTFAHECRKQVFRTAAVGGGALQKRKQTVLESKRNKGIVFQHPNEDVDGFYILNGEQIVFWGNSYKNVDGHDIPTTALTDVWTDIGFTGIAKEGNIVLKNAKKPEQLLKRIVELTTSPGEYVLDYHAGSGTTAAVSHKLKRKYITIEQLNYGSNACWERLKNVINGDTTGISKLVDWQGGGSFIYCELAEQASTFLAKIESADTVEKLFVVWQELKESSNLSFKVDPILFDNQIESFKALPLEEQKQLLIEMIDKNQLYVNLSDIQDESNNISAKDIEMNNQFYGA
ncbi:DNA methyltransferase [Vibrio jasicida]|uniref:DNA methyltransferase n=1 Tax=Vibrio jasicida TaxID=766224 RepID=UPI0005F09A79|nr:site-specific DNA-methyltransferase [Vibrio jasicida]